MFIVSCVRHGELHRRIKQKSVVCYTSILGNVDYEWMVKLYFRGERQTFRNGRGAELKRDCFGREVVCVRGL